MALGCAAWLPPPPPLQLRWSACAEPVEAGRPEPCEGAFQCGIRHVSPDVLSAPEPQRGRVWKGFALPGAFYHFLWRRPEHSRGHGGTAEVWNWWSRVEWEGGGESGVPRAPARRRAGRPQHRSGGNRGSPRPCPAARRATPTPVGGWGNRGSPSPSPKAGLEGLHSLKRSRRAGGQTARNSWGKMPSPSASRRALSGSSGARPSSISASSRAGSPARAARST